MVNIKKQTRRRAVCYLLWVVMLLVEKDIEALKGKRMKAWLNWDFKLS